MNIGMRMSYRWTSELIQVTIRKGISYITRDTMTECLFCVLEIFNLMEDCWWTDQKKNWVSADLWLMKKEECITGLAGSDFGK